MLQAITSWAQDICSLCKLTKFHFKLHWLRIASFNKGITTIRTTKEIYYQASHKHKQEDEPAENNLCAFVHKKKKQTLFRMN